MNKYAGIGSRKTPLGVLGEMTSLAAYLARQGWVLRSGGAQGADTAFEHGSELGGGAKEIFLPWRGFNNRASVFSGACPEAFEIAAGFHPVWDRLQFYAKKFHARNVHQILGPDLNDPVKFVVCWTPGGKVKGGTATAILLARSRGIPVFNIADGFYFREPLTTETEVAGLPCSIARP